MVMDFRYVDSVDFDITTPIFFYNRGTLYAFPDLLFSPDSMPSFVRALTEGTAICFFSISYLESEIGELVR